MKDQSLEIIREPMALSRLQAMAAATFGDMVKAVVDVDLGIMAVDAELHADQEELLLRSGSSRSNLWGINLYPELNGDDWIEFDSMINLRPAQGNRSRGVDDAAVRERIVVIVERLVAR